MARAAAHCISVETRAVSANLLRSPASDRCNPGMALRAMASASSAIARRGARRRPAAPGLGPTGALGPPEEGALSLLPPPPRRRVRGVPPGAAGYRVDRQV